jgi:hypothetical protein
VVRGGGGGGGGTRHSPSSNGAVKKATEEEEGEEPPWMEFSNAKSGLVSMASSGGEGGRWRHGSSRAC